MGLMVKETGENETFATYGNAKQFAQDNCAFEYKIVEL